MYIIREVYYGWSLRYIHSNGASFLFTVLFIHIGRGLYYGSYYYNSNSWFSGIIIFIILMAIASPNNACLIYLYFILCYINVTGLSILTFIHFKCG